ncbi:hypothetical protein G4O51_09415 [Candidatus Bathyarchaeota archaeon A05DMB-2]|jgi:hypothetical protein|nr:hypothetical protein [Candidatus Bathyarchaeota archaeon A05DMB-2]
MSSPAFPLGSAVYVRYKDHVLYKNIQQPVADAVERETIGWLTKQNDEIILIEHDRTITNPQIPSGQGNGVIILKSCVLEIRELPLQKTSNGHLNCPDAIVKGEYALQPTKRKTQPRTKTENTERKNKCKH